MFSLFDASAGKVGIVEHGHHAREQGISIERWLWGRVGDGGEEDSGVLR